MGSQQGESIGAQKVVGEGHDKQVWDAETVAVRGKHLQHGE